eukprot:gene8047-9590_t
MRVQETVAGKDTTGSMEKEIKTGNLNERSDDLVSMLQPHVSFPVGTHNIVDAVQSLLDQLSFIRNNLKDAIQAQDDSLEAIQNLQDILKAAQLMNENVSEPNSSVPVAASLVPPSFSSSTSAPGGTVPATDAKPAQVTITRHSANELSEAPFYSRLTITMMPSCNDSIVPFCRFEGAQIQCGDSILIPADCLQNGDLAFDVTRVKGEYVLHPVAVCAPEVVVTGDDAEGV